MRGEHSLPTKLSQVQTGSSLHAWGTRLSHTGQYPPSRFIPTCVGNTAVFPGSQQFFTPCPDSHHDTLRLHGALVQGEVSFSRCISSYCTTGWRLPPLLYLSIIVTFIDMNNRAARPLILHVARPLTLCINGVYISAALERIDTTT